MIIRVTITSAHAINIFRFWHAHDNKYNNIYHVLFLNFNKKMKFFLTKR